jgi:hypothetical protein
LAPAARQRVLHAGCAGISLRRLALGVVGGQAALHDTNARRRLVPSDTHRGACVGLATQ